MKAFRMNKDNLQKLHEIQFDEMGKGGEQWVPREGCRCRACKEYTRCLEVMTMWAVINPNWEKEIDGLTFMRMMGSMLISLEALPDPIEAIVIGVLMKHPEDTKPEKEVGED